MRNQKIVRISFLGIIVNALLVLFKMIIGVITSSIAIILDAINNLTDALSAIITIVGIKLSSKKPDREHPYGHGRIEYLAAIIIAVIVLVAGLTFLKESIEKIINPATTNYSFGILLCITVFVFVKYFFGLFVRRQGDILNSNSLKVTGIDAINDAFITLSTLIAAVISAVYHINIEGYIAIIISIYIFKNAFIILRETVNDMIGIRADSSVVNQLKKNILKHEAVLDVYDIDIHNYGPSKVLATAYIQVDDDTKAKELHGITHNIATDIYEKMGISLTLGIYATNDDKKAIQIKEYIAKILKKYKSIKQMHGFYVDNENKNISFDLIFSFDEKNPEEITEQIKVKLKEKYKDFNYSIIIDRD